MERCHENDLMASQSSTYQSLKYQEDIDEILRETSDEEPPAESLSPNTTKLEAGIKRKSMAQRLEEDENAFVLSLESLALEAEKRGEALPSRRL